MISTVLTLSTLPKYKKFQLANIAGYNVIEHNRKCFIEGADNMIDNVFNSIDEVLMLIKLELSHKGFIIAA